MEAPDQQTGGGGENYLWDRWSNGNTRVHTVSGRTTDETITAYYLEVVNYTIPLLEGWNLISVPLVQLDTGLDVVLASISGQWNYIMSYNSTHPEEWSTNSFSRPDQLDTLNMLDHKMGFWIEIDEPGVELIVEGVDLVSKDIPLYAGWNLVGYPSLTQASIVTALAGTGYDAVEGFDAVEPYRLTPLAGSYMMKPGEGYWVHVPADTTWTVNW